MFHELYDTFRPLYEKREFLENKVNPFSFQLFIFNDL